MRTDATRVRAGAIFGLSRKGWPLGMVPLACGRCGHPGPQSLVRRRTRFTVFFVPVLPLPARVEARCPVCGTERRVDADEARRLGV